MGIGISRVSSFSPYYDKKGKQSFEFTQIQLDIIKEEFIDISDAFQKDKQDLSPISRSPNQLNNSRLDKS